jgi:hypothetical protein
VGFFVGQIPLADDIRRMGCQLRRVAALALPDAVATAVAWDTEDEDTDSMFAPTGTTITIPATGLWAIAATIVRAAAVNARSFLQIVPNNGAHQVIAGALRFSWDNGEAIATAAAVIPLDVTNTFRIEAFADGAAASTMTAALTCYRVNGG